MIVPTLRVVTPWLTLCVKWDAERPGGIPTRSVGTITKVAHFCSMCGPKFCSIKITQEVREYAANQKILIVPTLRVVTPWLMLCVKWDAERPGQHSHAERGNDHQTQ